jgi:hypothetical protein
MDTPIYDYTTYEEYIDITSFGKLTNPQQAANMTMALGKSSEKLIKFAMDFEGGRYEVISRSLLRIGDVLVVSYFMRRVAGQQNIP